MKLSKITSKKHPNAIFFKTAGTKDDFICKFYPGHEEEAEIFRQAIEKIEPVSLQPPPKEESWWDGHWSAARFKRRNQL